MPFKFPWKQLAPQIMLQDESPNLSTAQPARSEYLQIGVSDDKGSQSNHDYSQGSDQLASQDSKSDSNVPAEDLLSIAMHPYAAEDKWLQACTELNFRNDQNLVSTKHSPWIQKHYLLPTTIITFLIAGAVFVPWGLVPNVSFDRSATGSLKPYVLASSESRSDDLKERSIIRLAQSIDERGWTYLHTATYLGVKEAEIAKLMNGKDTSFSIEAINKMLFALGESSSFSEIPSTKEWQQSVAYYTRLISINPADSRLFNRRAFSYSGLNQNDLAIADLTHCVELQPNRPGPRSNLAVALMNAGRLDESLQALNKLHTLFPDYDIYQNRALVLNALGEYDQALRDCTKSIQLMQTQRPGPYWNRAGVYEKLRKMELVIADYRRVLEIDPRYKSAAIKIAKLERKLQPNQLKKL